MGINGGVVPIKATHVDESGRVVRDAKLQEALDRCFSVAGIRGREKNIVEAAEEGSKQTHWWDD